MRDYILISYFIVWIYADEFHVVSPGPCLQEGDAYCMRRVANSMCSIEKNECFCKPGYVSIQESYGITCKTQFNVAKQNGLRKTSGTSEIIPGTVQSENSNSNNWLNKEEYTN
ncbi:unnamed protein product [Trichobilharzia regenti]|nr:unnamed protein product [Trichobilharzia regenti]